MPIQHRTNNKAARAVGFYKGVLQGCGKPQEEMVVGNTTDFNNNINPIHSRKHPAIDLDVVSQETNNSYTSHAAPQPPTNTITRGQLTQQLTTFQEEMTAANKIFFKEREKQLREDLKSIVTTKIESVQ
eukprot:5835423-Ditylum_brightwellii.AAC.2